MSDLPPDPPRLRAILAHLNQQLADNETVHTYLDLQRNAVLDALRAAEGTAPTGEPSPQPPEPAPHPAQPAARTTTGYQIDRARAPDGPVPTVVHLGDCHMAGALARPVTAQEARLALTDSQLEACAYCRPDTELGILDG